MQRDRIQARRLAGSKGLDTCSSVPLSRLRHFWRRSGAVDFLNFDTPGPLKSYGGVYHVHYCLNIKSDQQDGCTGFIRVTARDTAIRKLIANEEVLFKILIS